MDVYRKKLIKIDRHVCEIYKIEILSMFFAIHILSYRILQVTSQAQHQPQQQVFIAQVASQEES